MNFMAIKVSMGLKQLDCQVTFNSKLFSGSKCLHLGFRIITKIQIMPMAKLIFHRLQLIIALLVLLLHGLVLLQLLFNSKLLNC